MVRVPSLLPPGTIHAFVLIAPKVQHSHRSSILIDFGYLTLSRFPPIDFHARKGIYQYMRSTRIHSGGFEPTKSIVAETSFTSYATSGAGTTWN